ncbi:MAG: tRNA 2-selenouridine(34) synthase MnmH [Gemmataceae bacterium]|nr:tRNA 2-selenouridine(34) synthase MnmH [Gemmataceae bacterium]
MPCPYDDVIDVRSPVEFAEDHVPGAVNLPVLSNAERVEVGTIYRVDGAFAARKLGAAYVSANISRHLRDHFATKSKEYKPLIYCWRGGQRSASLAIVLAQVGWRVTVLRGGYKTYREHVRRELDLLPGQFTYRLIAGATGTGKTRLLHALARQGAQALDLEALARHRGSLLGGDGPQPSQKGFESQLLTELECYDPDRPVWVEAESNRIGNLHLPASLWRTMRCATGVELRVPIEQRVRQLLADYAHFVNDPDSLRTQLARISRRHGARQLSEWSRLIDAGSWGEFVASLLRIHYDPAYEQSARKCFPNLTRYRDLHDTTCATLATLATELRLESSDTISLTSPL